MASKPFHFKRFSIAQDQCAHKVGTDGVLLGAWVNIGENDRRILDVGTGTGLIALMIAQRSGPHTSIDALDVEEAEALQAMENVRNSPWPRKVRVHHGALQDFVAPQLYDLIVSNPPYFADSLLPPDRHRTRARHTVELTFQDLLHHSVRLLAPGRRLAVILPFAEGGKFIAMAAQHKLFPVRTTTVRSRAHKAPERLLLEFSQNAPRAGDGDIVIHREGDHWSDDYVRLTKEFYLRL